MMPHHLPSNKIIWDSIAESFDTTRRKPWTQVLTFLQPCDMNQTLIDLGCGNGRHLPACAKCSSQVIGIDISSKLLAIARQHMRSQSLKNITFLNTTLTHLPFNSDSIDGALYIASLHTLRTKEQRISSLKELLRILKPKKKALVSVWSREINRCKKLDSKTNSFDNITSSGDVIVYWRQHNLNVPRFYHLYEKTELINDLNQAGFIISKVEDASIASKTITDNYFATVIKP